MKKIMLTTAVLTTAAWLGAAISAEAAPVRIDATNLDAFSLFVTGPDTYYERFPASTVKELDLDEGSFVLSYNSSTSPLPSVSFEVTSNGSIDFDGAQDPYVSGRGTDTLVVHGLAVSLDVTALDTVGPRILAVPTNVFSSGTATVNLLPGGHRLWRARHRQPRRPGNADHRGRLGPQHQQPGAHCDWQSLIRGFQQ